MMEFGDRQVPEHLEDVIRNPSIDPRDTITRTVLAERGLLPQLTNSSPELMERLRLFLLGEKRLLIVAGESGMGKSLIGADIRTVQRDLNLLLPPEQRIEMAILTWDRVHKTFFNIAETDLGLPIELPKGETHLEARQKISLAMSYGVNFALDNLPGLRVLVEAPLFGSRGEDILPRLGSLSDEAQLLVMHSPQSRLETLLEGRDLITSGQEEAMLSMRSFLLELAGVDPRGMSQEAQDAAIKEWQVKKQLSVCDGMVVEWDPDKNRKRYNESRREFRNFGLSPDITTPRVVSRYVMHQFEDMLDTIRDIDDFLKKVTT